MGRLRVVGLWFTTPSRLRRQPPPAGGQFIDEVSPSVSLTAASSLIRRSLSPSLFIQNQAHGLGSGGGVA